MSVSDYEDAFDLPNLCFMRANVVSGYGTGVVLQTGSTRLRADGKVPR
jgi:Mg2+-importing ATPase